MKRFLDEALTRSLARVFHHTQHSPMAIITAHRKEFKADENNARNKELEGKIKKHFGYSHVRGEFIEGKGTKDEKKVKEHSFMITGKPHQANHLRAFVKKQGEHYGQDSVLYKHPNQEDAHLIGTSKHNEWPAYGKSESVGKWHPNRASEFQSMLRRGSSDKPPKPGKQTASKKSFTFANEEGEWETFGFFDPIMETLV